MGLLVAAVAVQSQRHHQVQHDATCVLPLPRSPARLAATRSELARLLGCSEEQVDDVMRRMKGLCYIIPPVLGARWQRALELLGCEEEQFRKKMVQCNGMLLTMTSEKLSDNFLQLQQALGASKEQVCKAAMRGLQMLMM